MCINATDMMTTITFQGLREEHQLMKRVLKGAFVSCELPKLMPPLGDRSRLVIGFNAFDLIEPTWDRSDPSRGGKPVADENELDDNCRLKYLSSFNCFASMQVILCH